MGILGCPGMLQRPTIRMIGHNVNHAGSGLVKSHCVKP